MEIQVKTSLQAWPSQKKIMPKPSEFELEYILLGFRSSGGLLGNQLTAVVDEQNFCADDFGLYSCVDDGIIELAHCRAIDLASCITVGNGDYTAGESTLRSLSQEVRAGLHIVFSGPRIRPISQKSRRGGFVGPDGNFLPLCKLVQNSFLRRLEMSLLRDEIKAQYHSFCDRFGKAPAFVDGHEYVHQLPMIAEALTDVLKEVSADGSLFVRNTSCFVAVDVSLKARVKSAILSSTGKSCGRRLAQAGLHVSGRCVGVLDYNQISQVTWMKSAGILFGSKNPFLWVVHPAKPRGGRSNSDPIADGREKEFGYLISSEFLQLRQKFRSH